MLANIFTDLSKIDVLVRFAMSRQHVGLFSFGRYFRDFEMRNRFKLMV